MCVSSLVLAELACYLKTGLNPQTRPTPVYLSSVLPERKTKNFFLPPPNLATAASFLPSHLPVPHEDVLLAKTREPRNRADVSCAAEAPSVDRRVTGVTSSAAVAADQLISQPPRSAVASKVSPLRRSRLRWKTPEIPLPPFFTPR